MGTLGATEKFLKDCSPRKVISESELEVIVAPGYQLLIQRSNACPFQTFFSQIVEEKFLLINSGSLKKKKKACLGVATNKSPV